MPRNLSFNLNHIMTDSASREPIWKIQLYDLRSTTDTINDVVLFNKFGTGGLLPLTGPRDFTSDTTTIQVNEERGDYVGNGVAASSITVNLIDETGLFDPLLLLGLDPASAEYEAAVGRFLRAGNAVVITLGDQRVDPSEWKNIFTGEIIGQAGRSRSRSGGPKSDMSFQAVGREARFLKYNRTSDDYGTSTNYRNAAINIAQDKMGLDANEIDFSGWGSQTFGHASVQFVDEPPLVMIAQLMFPDGLLPKFDGDGILTQVTSLISGAPDRVYENLDIFLSLERPWSNVEMANCVIVLGLDKEMTKISQPLQRLATSDITTGFFATDEDYEVFWADDKTIVAENVQARILKSVNGGLSVLGGSEEFTEIPAPGPGGGSIGMRIEISTGFAPWLVIFFLATYVALAFIPDEVALVATIPVGRVVQAIALGGALFIMTKIGRGQYEFLGVPIEWVYQEIKARACVAGASEFEENVVTIENHLINTQTDANTAAKNTLLLLQAEENPRTATLLHDLRLEPDDIFEIPGPRLFLIDRVTYTLTRSDRAFIASMDCFEVTPGVIA